MTMVLIFCIEFWKLSHLTRDLSKAEKKINVVILSENSCHFVSLSACNNSYFLLSLRYVLCWMGQLPKFITENADPSHLMLRKVFLSGVVIYVWSHDHYFDLKLLDMGMLWHVTISLNHKTRYWRVVIPGIKFIMCSNQGLFLKKTCLYFWLPLV